MPINSSLHKRFCTKLLKKLPTLSTPWSIEIIFTSDPNVYCCEWDTDYRKSTTFTVGSKIVQDKLLSYLLIARIVDLVRVHHWNSGMLPYCE